MQGRILPVRRIRKFLCMECTQMLVNAFVTSRLDYCNSLLYGLPNNQLHKLQRVQNDAARLICNVIRFDHIAPSLHFLHWLPIIYRIQFKALNGLAPLYISQNLCSISQPLDIISDLLWRHHYSISYF